MTNSPSPLIEAMFGWQVRAYELWTRAGQVPRQLVVASAPDRVFSVRLNGLYFENEKLDSFIAWILRRSNAIAYVFGLLTMSFRPTENGKLTQALGIGLRGSHEVDAIQMISLIRLESGALRMEPGPLEVLDPGDTSALGFRLHRRTAPFGAEENIEFEQAWKVIDRTLIWLDASGAPAQWR